MTAETVLPLYEEATEQNPDGIKAIERAHQIDCALSSYYIDLLKTWTDKIFSLPLPLQCALSDDFEKGYRAARLQILTAIVQDEKGEQRARECAIRRIRAKKRVSAQPQLPL